MSARSPRRIALIVGDTVGHFYPALAVAEAYRRRHDHVDILFLGPPGVCARLAARHGYPFHALSGSQLVRVGAGGKVAAVGRTAVGVAQARRLMRAHRVRLAIGFGGFVSGGALLAARSLRLQTAIHEANVWPGLANRLLGPVVHRIYLNFAAAGQHFRQDRVVLTGMPIRAELAASATDPRPGPTENCVRVLVSGGSRGTAFLNREVPALLGHIKALGMALEVRHQAGDGSHRGVEDAYSRAGVPTHVFSYLDEMTDAYRDVHFAIARAGAGTIAELATLGIPALLVPLVDAAEDHQVFNAIAFVEAGGGLWVREAEWNAPELARSIGNLLTPFAWSSASRSVRSLATHDAADRIVSDCEERMRGRW